MNIKYGTHFNTERPPVYYSPHINSDRALISKQLNEKHKRNIQITSDNENSTQTRLTSSTKKSKNDKIKYSLVEKKTHNLKDLEFNSDSNSDEEKVNLPNNNKVNDSKFKPESATDLISNLNKNIAYNFDEKEKDQIKESEDIIKFLSPKFEKIKFKEKQLDSLTLKVREYIKEYQQNSILLEKMIKKHKIKKDKINKFSQVLNTYRKDLIKKEEDITDKENNLQKFEDFLTEENQKLNLNQEKFNIYIEKKSNELIQKSEEMRDKIKEFSTLQGLLNDEENQNNKKTQFLLNLENELKLKSNKLETDKYEFETYKKEFYLNKEEFDLYSGEIVQKYNDMKLIQNEINKNKSVLEKLESDIKIKENELNCVNTKNYQTFTLLNQKSLDLDIKTKLIEQREKDINIIKQDLDEKLQEVSCKLEDIQKTTRELKNRENILKIKQTIDRDLDLKLNEIETSEIINQKKFALQQKLLNEEINRKISNKSKYK